MARNLILKFTEHFHDIESYSFNQNLHTINTQITN